MQRSDYVDTTLYTCLASIFFPHKAVFSSYCVHGEKLTQIGFLLSRNTQCSGEVRDALKSL